MENILKYKDLIKSGTIVLKEYSQLSDLSKEKARKEILECNMIVYTNDLCSYISNNINLNINKSKIPHFIKKKRYIKKLLNDVKYFEKYITENLCHFLVDGTYITYSISL